MSVRVETVGRLRPLQPFLLVGLLGFATFSWLSDAVEDRNGVTVVDGPVAIWFAAHRSLTEGHLGLLLAKVTAPAVLVVLIAITVFLLQRRGFRRESFVLAAATVLAYLAGGAVKYAEHRTRPLSPINLAPEGEPSYPSGHVLVITTVSVVAVGLVWAHLNRASRIFASLTAVALVALVSVDRLVVGAHWLTDVAGSITLAGGLAALCLAGIRLLPGQDAGLDGESTDDSAK